MLGFTIFLGLLTIILWVGYKFTGALFTACCWLFIKVPCAILMAMLGLVSCMTILLIPVGRGCFKTTLKLLLPG